MGLDAIESEQERFAEVEHGYKVIRKLGRGFSGSVYLVEKQDERYAMKVIRTEGNRKAAMDKVAKAELVLRNLHHERIIGFIAYFKSENDIYILMEFCGGGSLSDQIYWARQYGKKFSGRLLLKWTHELLLGLVYLHATDNKDRIGAVLHRDIKPGNVLLTSNGQVKICDFGFCKDVERQSEQVTSHLGTGPYMAPELVKSEPYNVKADIYSLGCTLFELLVLESFQTYLARLDSSTDNPVKSKGGSLLSQVSSSSPLVNNLVFPHYCPNWLMKLIKKMVDDDPNCRPSALELLTEVNEIMKEYETIIEKTLTGLPRVTATSAPADKRLNVNIAECKAAASEAVNRFSSIAPPPAKAPLITLDNCDVRGSAHSQRLNGGGIFATKSYIGGSVTTSEVIAAGEDSSNQVTTTTPDEVLTNAIQIDSEATERIRSRFNDMET